MARRVFINYRRNDAQGYAEAIARELEKLEEIGPHGVFLDVRPDVMPSGPALTQYLRQGVADSDVVVAVIGPRWLEEVNERAQRGDRDFVLEELTQAFAQGTHVLRVLVGGARMPEPHELPSAIRGLAECRQVEVRPGYFTIGYEELVSDILPILRAVEAGCEQHAREGERLRSTVFQDPYSSTRAGQTEELEAEAERAVAIGRAREVQHQSDLGSLSEQPSVLTSVLDSLLAAPRDPRSQPINLPTPSPIAVRGSSIGRERAAKKVLGAAIDPRVATGRADMSRRKTLTGLRSGREVSSRAPNAVSERAAKSKLPAVREHGGDPAKIQRRSGDDGRQSPTSAQNYLDPEGED